MIAFSYNDDLGGFPSPAVNNFKSVQMGPNGRFALIDFQTQQITEYPSLQFQMEFDVCSASILQSKIYGKIVVTHLQELKYFKGLVAGGDSDKISHLMSYDLDQGSNGQWKIHGSWTFFEGPRVLNFWQSRGYFYSLMEDGNLILHQNLNDWKVLKNLQQNFSEFVGNGALYFA